jgi:hypothetical protein
MSAEQTYSTDGSTVVDFEPNLAGASHLYNTISIALKQFLDTDAAGDAARWRQVLGRFKKLV